MPACRTCGDAFRRGRQRGRPVDESNTRPAARGWLCCGGHAGRARSRRAALRGQLVSALPARRLFPLRALEHERQRAALGELAFDAAVAELGQRKGGAWITGNRERECARPRSWSCQREWRNCLDRRCRASSSGPSATTSRKAQGVCEPMSSAPCHSPMKSAAALRVGVEPPEHACRSGAHQKRAAGDDHEVGLRVIGQRSLDAGLVSRWMRPARHRARPR